MLRENYWYREYEHGELGCAYRLRDTLGVAAGLHEYYRNSDIIQMAHYAQTVNVIDGRQEIPFDGTLTLPPYSVNLYRVPLQ